jgi:pimeloyl-ACP methyl ester carboxylesterase
MLAFNMMVPPKVRANMAGRTLNIDDILMALKLPVLVTQGATDRLALPAAAKYTAAKISGAKLSLYDGIGHAPFWCSLTRDHFVVPVKTTSAIFRPVRFC